MRYKLAIFDFDDTLVHLNIDWEEVKMELIRRAEKGGEKVPAKIKKADPMDAANWLCAHGHVQLVVDGFRENEKKCVDNSDYVVFPAMAQLLKELKKEGYLIAIASGNTTMTIKEVLEKEGIIPNFVAGQDSTKMNKPYPDILNLILQKLKVKKEESVFVGNSSFDSRAGRNAGIKTIIIRPGNKEDAEKLRRILL